MTTEKTPPPGKVWVTFETDHDVWDDPFAWDPKALVGNVPVKVERGVTPEKAAERAARFLSEAEKWFRSAADSMSPGNNIVDAPHRMLAGCRVLGDALAALREDL